MNRQLRSWAATGIAVLVLAGCESRREEPAASAPPPQTTPANAAPPVATPPPAPSPIAAATPTPAASPAVKEVRIDVKLAGPIMPPKGNLRGYQIENPQQLTAGALADGFIGDYAIENDMLKAVVRSPGSKPMSQRSAGLLVDLVHKKNPVDYLDQIQTVSDVTSTGTSTVYDQVAPPQIEGGSTITIVSRGHVATVDSITTENPLRPIPGLDVVTSYSLGRNQGFLTLTTRYTNGTTSPVTLAPGDVANWGTAGVFLEGMGAVPGESGMPAKWIAAAVDDFSAAIVTSGTEPAAGFHTTNISVVPAIGGQRQAVLPATVPKATPLPSEPFRRSSKPSEPDGVDPLINALNAPRNVPMAPAPPTTETRFNPPVPPPAPETNYSPAPKPRTDAGDLPSREALGGGGAETQSSGQVGSERDPASIVLKPGESFEYTRYLVVSDRDFSRLSNFAYETKGTKTAMISGIVLEAGTDAPIEGAEIRVLGGPNWSAQSQFSPRPFTKALTRADGQFALRVPAGGYVVVASKVGRGAVSPLATVSVKPGDPTPIVPIILSRPSNLVALVSEAETPTSSPLPCKITIQAKPGPGSEPLDYGFGPSVTDGVRDVFYAWRGGARIPVTPGRYLVTISRGIEYGNFEADIAIPAGQDLELSATLPRMIDTAGMVGMDAGVLTNASASSTVSTRDRVIMAACEGVPVLVSGDYNTATNLQPVIEQLGLGKWMKAFMGIRFLVAKDEQAAEVLVYPLTGEDAARLTEFRTKEKNLPPDVFLADLKKQFPNLIIQIERPLDPDAGYLQQFKFDDQKLQFEDGQVPPPDFDAIQIYDGKHVDLQVLTMPRYFDLLRHRTTSQAGSGPITAMAGSMSRLPYGEEVGYPRAYLYTTRDTLDRLTGEDVVKAVRGQKVMVTNGPFLDVKVQDPATQAFNAEPGSVVDVSTTQVARVQLRVRAVPWVSLLGIDVALNGLPKVKIEVPPTNKLVRYPVRVTPGADRQVVYPEKDSVLTGMAFSPRRPLSPIVPANPAQLGGEVFPIVWTGPVFLDKNGDGKVRIGE